MKKKRRKKKEKEKEKKRFQGPHQLSQDFWEEQPKKWDEGDGRKGRKEEDRRNDLNFVWNHGFSRNSETSFLGNEFFFSFQTNIFFQFSEIETAILEGFLTGR